MLHILDGSPDVESGGVHARLASRFRLGGRLADHQRLRGGLVPLGLLLIDRSVRLPSLGWNAGSFVVLIVPATVWLGAWEGGRSGATPGNAPLRPAGGGLPEVQRSC